MESAGLWVAMVAALAGVASAVFAFVQAKAATDDRKDAEDARDEARAARDESARLAAEANAAFTRQAEAQEETNRLKQIEMTPPDWSTSTVGRNTCRVQNTSTELLLVEGFEVKPPEAAGLVPFGTKHDDGRYEYGDAFTFSVIKAFGEPPEKLTVIYRRSTDKLGELSRFHIAL